MTQHFICECCRVPFAPLDGAACAECDRLLCLRCFYGRFAPFTRVRRIVGERTCRACIESVRELQRS